MLFVVLQASHATDPLLNIFPGDQSNETQLANLITKFGPWEVIVDDGGHTMQQQRISFMALFPTLMPGGLYFLEDLHTSFISGYGGNGDGSGDTAMALMTQLASDLTKISEKLPSNLAAIANTIRNVDCFEKICVVVKKK